MYKRQLFLGAVAGVSLLVGTIGIANSVYMSVTERIAEIGILKSIGAKESEILSLFLIEGGIIGLLGGIIGIVSSVVLARVIGFYISVELSHFVLVGGVFFSFLLGVIASYLPARWASKLDILIALGKR